MSLLRQSIRCCLIKRIHQYSLDLQCNNYRQHRLWRLYCSSAISHPTPDGSEKSYSPKVLSIVEEIAKLPLIEVANLNECLKKKLNIKDVPMMMGAAPVAAPAAAGDDEGESEPQVTKSSFTVKLASFDAAKKIALIKEVKNLMEGMNLVQAKQFIESAPQVLKADIAKDEAENIKKSLEAVGAVCEIS
ncbi:39S ribosomal protein L12, mitochondrial-like [Argiope bruennichi]|uniref:39S ribosomal protein L12, mitochondrial-like n=1 Tax=Argiope bruennichi TaxID=94029 RepID=UPI00249499BC|nr:39S ribosomal protein L12, mitochondrial-like [Argiope bruennichi]